MFMKYQIGQTLYYISDNRVHSAPITSAQEILNGPNQRGGPLNPFGEAGVKYATCHGIFSEDLVFPSKEELLASL